MDIPSQRVEVDEDRHATVMRLIAHARYLAHKHSGNCNLAEADIESDALYGLTKALQSYDPNRGASFYSYAYMRMAHEIQDGMRDRDHLSRSQRAIQRKSGEDPGDVDPRLRPPISIDLLKNNGEVIDLAESDPFIDLRQQAADREQAHAILNFIALAVGVRNAAIIRRYYLDSIPMHQVAAEFGITESRVSQIVKRTLIKVRADLAH